MTAIKSHHILNMRQNNLYSCAVLQKLPVTNFEWIEGTSHFNEEGEEGYFLEADA